MLYSVGVLSICHQILNELFIAKKLSHQKVPGPVSAVGNTSGFASSIPARSHTFVEIDHELISVCHSPPSANSSWVVVSYASVSYICHGHHAIYLSSYFGTIFQAS